MRMLNLPAFRSAPNRLSKLRWWRNTQKMKEKHDMPNTESCQLWWTHPHSCRWELEVGGGAMRKISTVSVPSGWGRWRCRGWLQFEIGWSGRASLRWHLYKDSKPVAIWKKAFQSKGNGSAPTQSWECTWSISRTAARRLECLESSDQGREW